MPHKTRQLMERRRRREKDRQALAGSEKLKRHESKVGRYRDVHAGDLHDVQIVLRFSFDANMFAD